MLRWSVVGLAVLFVTAGAAPASGTRVGADGRNEPEQRLAAGQSVRVVKTPADVTEGDRFPVVVRVESARRAKNVRLELATGEDYAGRTVWDTAAKRKVRAKTRQKFTLVAGALNPLKLRAITSYKNGRLARSKTVRIVNWRWFDLARFPAYYSTAGTYPYDFRTFLMNGSAYRGWWVSGGSSWESRHTPGRNCRAFRGVVGVEDKSQDGSSAEITLLADEAAVVYRSPTLSPGATHPIETQLARPYRFSVQARLTSTGYSYPAIGAPQLLCDYDSDSHPS